MRNGGKLCFVTLRDGDGTELQAMLSLDKVGAEALAPTGSASSTWVTWSGSPAR